MADLSHVQPVIESATAALALALETIAIAVVAMGSVLALAEMVRGMLRDASGHWKRSVWLHYAAWIVLALEFALAADICRTAIAPSWGEIGRLGAIAAIRTMLNFFLNRDLAELNPRAPSEGRP